MRGRSTTFVSVSDVGGKRNCYQVLLLLLLDAAAAAAVLSPSSHKVKREPHADHHTAMKLDRLTSGSAHDDLFDAVTYKSGAVKLATPPRSVARTMAKDVVVVVVAARFTFRSTPCQQQLTIGFLFVHPSMLIMFGCADCWSAQKKKTKPSERTTTTVEFASDDGSAVY